MTGKTTDGKSVVTFFEFVSTYGVDLETCIDFLHGKDLMPDWVDFYTNAVSKGWHPDRTLDRLDRVVSDVYGPEWRDEWRIRMETLRISLTSEPP